jgi:TPR repeat protein
MDKHQNYADYADSMNNARRKKGQEKLRAVALHFQSTVQRLPALTQELDMMLQSTEALDYEELLKRVEPVLQQAGDWLWDVDNLPRDLADDAEMKKFTADVCARLALANAARLIPSFYSFQQKVMGDREIAKREKAEAKRRASEEVKRAAEKEAQRKAEEIRRKEEEKRKTEEEAKKSAEKEAQHQAEELRRQEEEKSKAEQENDPNYQFELGMRYATGNGVEKDKNKAEFWLKKAAQQGNHAHQYFLANYYAEIGEKEDAVYWMNNSAEFGNIDAQSDLAYWQCGRKPIKWYWRDVEEETKNTSVTLNQRASYMPNVGVNISAGLMMLEQLSNLDHAKSQFRLGRLYLTGLTKKAAFMEWADYLTKDKNLIIWHNKEKGEYWMQKASAQGYKDAIKWLKENP